VLLSSLCFSSGYEDTNMAVWFQDLVLSLGLLSLWVADLVGGEVSVFFMRGFAVLILTVFSWYI